MKIGTCQSRKGSISRGELRVANGTSSDGVSVPVAIAQGKENGKTAFISAGVHGDELNGIVVLQRFIESFDVSQLRGTVILLPIVNVGGFRTGSRTVPEDDTDLNRCFPGDLAGTLSKDGAYALH